MHVGQLGCRQTRQRWLMNGPACFRQGSRGAAGVVSSPTERESTTSHPCSTAPGPAVASPMADPAVGGAGGRAADGRLIRTGPARVTSGAAADAGPGAIATGGAVGEGRPSCCRMTWLTTAELSAPHCAQTNRTGLAAISDVTSKEYFVPQWH